MSRCLPMVQADPVLRMPKFHLSNQMIKSKWVTQDLNLAPD